MISKTLAAGLIAAGSVTAAGTGAYLAVRQNTVDQLAPATVSQPAPTPGSATTPGKISPPQTPIVAEFPEIGAPRAPARAARCAGAG